MLKDTRYEGGVMAGSAYSIVVENTDIVVRVNRNMIDQDALTRFLDYLELETIRKQSQLTDEQAAALATDIDRTAWEVLHTTGFSRIEGQVASLGDRRSST